MAHAYACSGAECFCSLPYYDGNCNSAAAQLNSTIFAGSLGPGATAYYSFTFEGGASTAFITLTGPGLPATSLSSAVQMHVSLGVLPLNQSNSSPPDYSVLMPSGDPAKEFLPVPQPAPLFTPYFIGVLNTDQASGADFQIQVMQY